jgi:hypothetical protein
MRPILKEGIRFFWRGKDLLGHKTAEGCRTEPPDIEFH